MPKILDSVLDVIGETSMAHRRNVGRKAGSEILTKRERLSVGGSGPMRTSSLPIALLLLLAQACTREEQHVGPGVVRANTATLVVMPAANEIDLSTVKIRIERTPCLGWCPVYTVVIDGDGAVHYHGEHYVRDLMNREGRISTETVRELLVRFEAAHFVELEDEYVLPTTDLPSAYLTLELGGLSKRVRNYWDGDVTDWRGLEIADRKIHETLESLAGAIDAAVRVEQWTGTSEEIDALYNQHR